MTIIRPNSMPRFWWIVPWAYARTLNMTCNALKAYADKADACVEMQIRIIEDKDREIERLKEMNRYLEIESRTDHDRWILTLADLDELRKRGGQL